MSDDIKKTAAAVSSLDFYRIIRSQIEHEDNLVGQRQSWFIASQSFLFTAYAIVASNLKSTGSPWVNDQQHLIYVLIPIVSIVTCVLILMGSAGGLIAMRSLRQLHTREAQNERYLSLPPIQGFRRTFFLGQIGPVLMPPIFMIVWLYLLIKGG